MKKIDSNAIIDNMISNVKERSGWGPKKLKVKRLSKDAILPTKNNSSDAGFDLYAAEYATLHQGKQVLVSTGIAMEIPEGHVGLIWPRSGLSAKEGVDVLAGVIDSGYRGEIKVCLLKEYFINTSEIMLGCYGGPSTSYSINKGDKIAQILIQEVPQFEIVESTDLSMSDRGSNGFGSSGL